MVAGPKSKLVVERSPVSSNRAVEVAASRDPRAGGVDIIRPSCRRHGPWLARAGCPWARGQALRDQLTPVEVSTVVNWLCVTRTHGPYMSALGPHITPSNPPTLLLLPTAAARRPPAAPATRPCAPASPAGGRGSGWGQTPQAFCGGGGSGLGCRCGAASECCWRRASSGVRWQGRRCRMVISDGTQRGCAHHRIASLAPLPAACGCARWLCRCAASQPSQQRQQLTLGARLLLSPPGPPGRCYRYSGLPAICAASMSTTLALL
jgi:hypothetical protein